MYSNHRHSLLIIAPAPSITYQTVNDSGAGTDGLLLVLGVAIPDSGSGTDTLPSLQATTEIDDSAVGTDTIASMTAQASITDQGAGTDAIASAQARATVQDNGLGSELIPPIAASVTIPDSGTATEIVSCGPIWTIYDDGLGLDIVFRMQGEISLDGALLPHVLNIQVDEPSIVQDLPLMDGLPYRKQLGKQGRHITISGWTDSLSTLETIREYAVGLEHLLILPTGDSMNVHIVDVRTPETAEDYQTYNYEMDVLETVD